MYFLIFIPLITELNLTLYTILPIPHSIEENHSIILKTEFQQVSIIKNRRQFTTFTETKLLHCIKTEMFSVCPEFQPIQHESGRRLCEGTLFKNPELLLPTCETEIIVITKNFYHKLKYSNTRLYTTVNETFKVTCVGINERFIVKIKDQRLIKLKQEIQQGKLNQNNS